MKQFLKRNKFICRDSLNVVQIYNNWDSYFFNNFDDVKLLVNELDTYAADEKYIYTINSIIEDNKLDQLDIFTYSLNKS